MALGSHFVWLIELAVSWAVDVRRMFAETPVCWTRQTRPLP